MLRELRLRNVAIVERLDLEFPGGLIALTGETGAGKSIIVGALGLALGEKSRPEHQRTPGEESVVEALFAGPLPGGVRARLEAAGVPPAEDLLLRRVVSPGGRSRAFANDTAITLPTLEEIGRELVDIHGQHQHQSLLHAETHLDFLDGFARLLGKRERYREAWTLLEGLGREREQLERQEGERERRLEYLRFQHEELERAALQPGEEEQLRSERDVLRNVDRLAGAVGEAEAWRIPARPRRRASPGPRPAASPMPPPSIRLCCSWPRRSAGRRRRSRTRGASCRATSRVSRPTRRGSGRSTTGWRSSHGSRKSTAPRWRRSSPRPGSCWTEISRWEQGSARLAGLDRDIAAAAAAAAALAGELSRGREAAGPRLEKRILAELAALAMAG